MMFLSLCLLISKNFQMLCLLLMSHFNLTFTPFTRTSGTYRLLALPQAKGSVKEWIGFVTTSLAKARNHGRIDELLAEKVGKLLAQCINYLAFRRLHCIQYQHWLVQLFEYTYSLKQSV